MCDCTNPFCGADHAPYVPSQVVDCTGCDDPECISDATVLAILDELGFEVVDLQPEYREHDAEAFDEMVRQDMEGLS